MTAAAVRRGKEARAAGWPLAGGQVVTGGM